MKKLSLFLLLFVFLKLSYAQMFIKASEHHKLEVAMSLEWITYSNWDKKTHNEDYYYLRQISSELTYFPFAKNQLGIGLTYMHASINTNLDINRIAPKRYSTFLKYYYPVKIKYRFFKNMKFYTNLEFALSNYFNENGHTITLEKTKQPIIGLSPFAVSIRVWRNLHVNLTPKYSFFVHKENTYYLATNLQYNFFSNEKYKRKYKNKDFLTSFIFGTSVTYMKGNEIEHEKIVNEDTETVLHFNMAVSLNKRFNIGLDVHKIFYSDYNIEQNYDLFGIFSQYDFLARTKAKTRLFVETSINISDMYRDLFEGVSRKEYIYYHGLGAGVEIPLKFLSENFYLDLAFYNYHILNNIRTKSNYTQYIVGINYHIGKRVKDKR